jgi:hypothetical protein
MEPLIVRGGCNEYGQPILTITMNGIELSALVDTGANNSYLSEAKAKANDLNLTPKGTFIPSRIMKSSGQVFVACFTCQGIDFEVGMVVGDLQLPEYDAVLGIPFFNAADEFRLYPKERKWELIFHRPFRD